MLKLLIILVLVCSASRGAGPVSFLFGSTGCDECAHVKETWPVNDSGSPRLVFINCDEVRGFQMLSDLEAATGLRSGSSLPVVFAGGQFFSGDELKGDLAAVLIAAQKRLDYPKALLGPVASADKESVGGIVEYVFPASPSGDGPAVSPPVLAQAVLVPPAPLDSVTPAPAGSRSWHAWVLVFAVVCLLILTSVVLFRGSSTHQSKETT